MNLHSNEVRMVDARGVITTIVTNTLRLPWGIAMDAAGNLYVADRDSNTVEKATEQGDVTTIAGNDRAGFSGDGGPAVNAALNGPLDAVVDAQGEIYIADSDNNRVRRIDGRGIITTIAGTGMAGSTGDGGPATKATLNDPEALALDRQGNLYVVETGGNRVRRIDTQGIITTFAGTGQIGRSGDGGPATAAELSDPSGIVIDAEGNVYLADRGNGCIRGVDASAIIRTIVCSAS